MSSPKQHSSTKTTPHEEESKVVEKKSPPAPSKSLHEHYSEIPDKIPQSSKFVQQTLVAIKEDIRLSIAQVRLLG